MNARKVVALPTALNDANFLKRLREVAADSSRVVIVDHARKRMHQRKITWLQVVGCLQKGRIDEPAHLSPYGDWQAKVSWRCGGDDVRVVVVLEDRDDGDVCIVITVMR